MYAGVLERVLEKPTRVSSTLRNPRAKKWKKIGGRTNGATNEKHEIVGNSFSLREIGGIEGV